MAFINLLPGGTLLNPEAPTLPAFEAFVAGSRYWLVWWRPLPEVAPARAGRGASRGALCRFGESVLGAGLQPGVCGEVGGVRLEGLAHTGHRDGVSKNGGLPNCRNFNG